MSSASLTESLKSLRLSGLRQTLDVRLQEASSNRLRAREKITFTILTMER